MNYTKNSCLETDSCVAFECDDLTYILHIFLNSNKFEKYRQYLIELIFGNYIRMYLK